MSWSVIKQEEKTYQPEYLFQQFTQEEWKSYPFAGEEKLKWFRDGKLGLFFHVGISSVGKVDIGWSRETHKLPDPGKGFVPDEIYDGWAKEISLEEFQAEEWIDMAIDGGFRYVVIITKHHDGFHMWDTEYSDYKITNSPFGRDYLKELIDACHKKNMPVGLYYSQRDWHHPFYEPIAKESVDAIQEIPFYKVKNGETLRSGENHKKYITYMHNTVLELMKKYGKIDILWWDACWYQGMFQEWMWDSLELERKVRALQPDIIINNRASIPGDFDTPECRVGFVQRNRAWETCMPLGEEWAWTGNGIKSFNEILHQMLYSVCGDGNYLLSIGTMPNGKIAKEEQDGIRKLGEWMKKYGHTVYNTRSGPWNPGMYGGSVFRENTIYLHLMNPIGEKGLHFPLPNGEVKKICCVNGKKFSYTIKQQILIIHEIEENENDVILEIQMTEPIPWNEDGITILEEGNEYLQEPAVYGSVILKKNIQQNNFYIDFNEMRKITAITIQGKAKNIKIKTSVDGKEMCTVFQGMATNGTLDTKFMSYTAGAPVCGKKACAFQVEADEKIGELHLYGF